MSLKKRALLSLSGGLDSAAQFVLAEGHYNITHAITFDYGQRALAREIAVARHLCDIYGAEHTVVDCQWFRLFTKTSLVNRRENLPKSDEVAIDSLDTSFETAKRVWVPNRNGIFLNIAAAFAEANEIEFILTGFNIEEAQTFPDNTQDFLDKSNAAFEFSTANRVKSASLTIDMNKKQIVEQLKQRDFDLSLVWPCYEGGETWCGECESCLRYKAALLANGLSFDELSLRRLQ